jgi:fructan beta-fructosidase
VGLLPSLRLTDNFQQMRFKYQKGVALGCVLAALSGSCLAQNAPQNDIVVADFDAGTYGNWKVTGTAFGPGPVAGALDGQMEVAGFKGKGFVNSYHGGDKATGTLTSPPFAIGRKYLNFLIGGGKDENKLALRLKVDGKVVHQATGPNERPGRSERLDWNSFEVANYLGKSAVLEIGDEATGGWGHINVDNIIQSDTPQGNIPAERELTAAQPLLLLPVKNGAAKRTLTVHVGGKEVRSFEIELADGAPDWWAPLDITRWKGQKLAVRTASLPRDSQGLTQITQG